MATPFASQGHSDDQEKLRQIEGSPPERPKIGVLKPALPKIRVGFECEFVERPPDVLQTDCPVCLLIIREPNQVTCCGYSFCRACIDRVVTSKKPCPTCNEAEFNVFPDKRLQRSLCQFCVRCEHQKEGCEWSGELGQLDKHLNGLGNQLDGCEFTRVACIHCVQLFERRLVTSHQIGSCPRRPFSCDYCGDYGADFEDVVTNHWPVCGYRPVPCPNECGVYPERRNVHDHVNKDCPLTLVSCDFHYAGCQVRLPRRDILSHLNENLSSHMALLGAHSQRMAERVMEKDEAIGRLTNELSEKLGVNERKIVALEKENQALRNSLEQKGEELNNESKRVQEVSKRDCEALKQELAALKERQHESRRVLQQEMSYLKEHFNILPVEFTMTNFEQHKRYEYVWYSEPFYTHTRGYKLCLRVEANGYGEAKGRYVSVFAYLMCGKFDRSLEWPFQDAITVCLLNHLENKNHCIFTISFGFTATPEAIGRVTSCETADVGCGLYRLLGHSELPHSAARNRQFLKDDSLMFRVSRAIER